MEKNITYEIICKRGIDRTECRYRKQDAELHCSICSYAGYIKRDANYWKEKYPQQEDEQQQSDIQQ